MAQAAALSLGKNIPRLNSSASSPKSSPEGERRSLDINTITTMVVPYAHVHLLQKRHGLHMHLLGAV